MTRALLEQALDALDELESSARGDEPFNHAAAPLIRAFIEGFMFSPFTTTDTGFPPPSGELSRSMGGRSSEFDGEYP